MAPDMEEDRSSFLATTGPVEQDLELSEQDRAAAQAVADGLRAAKAANTRRAYASAWHLFCDWTVLTGRPAMPAAPQDVALYLGHLAAEGKTIATINQARAAISHAHAAQGILDFTQNPGKVMDDITFVRSHWWLVSEGFSLSTANSDVQKLPATLYHRIADSLAYAA